MEKSDLSSTRPRRRPGSLTAADSTGEPRRVQGRPRRGFAATVGFVVVLASASPAPAQQFLPAGIELAAAELSAGDYSWVEVEAFYSGRPGRCDIGEEVLAAEAERALRRDSIPTRREVSRAVLSVSVIALPSASSGIGCAVSVYVELNYWLSSSALGTSTSGWIRAFESGSLLVGSSHRSRARETVEESVSVLANRLRREIDALQGAR